MTQASPKTETRTAAKRDNLETRITDLAEPAIESLGFELLLVEIVSWRGTPIVRLFIDRAPADGGGPSPTPDTEEARPGASGADEGLSSDGFGVTVDECAVVSRELGPALEVADMLPGKWRLEVSSPGLNRPLAKPEHFRRYIGATVRLRLKKPLEGNRRNIKGRLEAADDEEIAVKDDAGQTLRLPMANLAKANIEYEF